MKRMIPTLALVLVAALVCAPLAAEGPSVLSGRAIKSDTSKPIRDMVIPAGPQTGLNKEVPIRNRPGADMRPDIQAAPDASLQDEARPIPGAAPTPPVDVSFSALSDDDNSAVVGFRIVPPDVNGDIGFDDTGARVYFQYINLIWAVYTDTGSVISGPNAGNTFWSGFGGPCETNNNGDPVVLYDDLAGRWMVSQFSINEGIQCVAVSATSDPLGGYHRYAFTITPGGLNDYPKMGVFTDGAGQSAYTFTSRDFGGAGGGFSNAAGVMERDKMLVGDPAAQFIKFSNPCVLDDCVEGQLPAHLAGPAPPAGTCPTFFTMADEQFDDSPHGMDGVRQHTLCVDWNNLANTIYAENSFAAGVDWDRSLGNGFSDCITPVMGGEALDCLAIFTMYRAQYRWHGTHASILLNSTADDGTSRGVIHWNEMRSSDGDSGWSIFQEGTYGPADGIDRWMGSIAMDGDGNIALGYSATSGSLFPAVRYTTRTPSSPAGVMDGGEESCHEGTGAQTASANRWGDYSSMSIDPSDDCTFWYTQEYYEVSGSFDFNTRVCSFKLADCGGGGGTFTLFAPTPGAADALNTFATIDATPNGKVNFVGGSAAGTTMINVPNCGLTAMDVGGTIKRLGFDTANGSGENDLMRLIPAGQAGNTVHLQAIDQTTCTKSNVVVHTWN